MLTPIKEMKSSQTVYVKAKWVDMVYYRYVVNKIKRALKKIK